MKLCVTLCLQCRRRLLKVYKLKWVFLFLHLHARTVVCVWHCVLQCSAVTKSVVKCTFRLVDLRVHEVVCDTAPFQITVLVRFSSVWFSLVTVLLIVCPRSLLLCPFHKKLRIWWKKSFGFCQTDNPRSSFMMYCYSTDLNVYTWVELTYPNRQVFWIQFLA